MWHLSPLHPFSEVRACLQDSRSYAKGLAVVLVAGHIVVQILPSAVNYLALIPAKTIPFAWNLITAGYIEQSIYGVVASTLCLLIMGKLLEPLVLHNKTGKLPLYAHFWLSRDPGRFLGCGFPSLMLLIAIAISFFTAESAKYLPTLIFGTYMSWIYLRYFQRKPETKLRGDPSVDFAFSSFFPEFLRPVIDPIASIFHRMLCGRFETSTEAHGYTLGGASLPGSDPIEASRRRERGARALEERLTAERLAAAHSAEELKKGASENV
ncbi:RHOMBOID-LIKE PROTEIN 19 [Salix viminalis]|uniref:RHOMBOID-LIKE PROTEIN 19 n=1 Tax=Salix viminalis TaxID=40686 RepID=A0A9Q0Z3P5_SALVM|nr:RHOMBOID-LIKE PROTEIN 19 [Salix viminalis]